MVVSLRFLAHLILHLANSLDRQDEQPQQEEKEEAGSADVGQDTTYMNTILGDFNGVLEDNACMESIHKDPLHNNRSRADSLDSGAGEELLLELDPHSGLELDPETGLELDPETGLGLISLAEVAEHCDMTDAWTVVYDKVYDVTEYLSRHPGGEEVMLEYVGYDATIAFRGVGHSQAAFRALDKYLIGILPRNQRLGYAEYY